MICEAETTTAPRAELSGDDALRFLTGGNAIFTLQSDRTGARFTYRIRKADKGELFFVSVLTGSDNEFNYEYAGIIRDGEFSLGRADKTRFTIATPCMKAFMWAYNWLSRGIKPQGLSVWHEGRCARCSRLLTVPESIASGFGPECIKKG